jgi:hypothetical protein
MYTASLFPATTDEPAVLQSILTHVKRIILTSQAYSGIFRYVVPRSTNTNDNRHSQFHLPKYAVPVFIRLVKEMTPIHNNKQNKVPLREEGVDPKKVRSDDEIFWIRGNSYAKFGEDHWEDLKLGNVRL